MSYSWFSCSVTLRFSTLYSCNSRILASVWSNVPLRSIRWTRNEVGWARKKQLDNPKHDDFEPKEWQFASKSSLWRISTLSGGATTPHQAQTFCSRLGCHHDFFMTWRLDTMEAKLVQTHWSRSCDTLGRDAKCKEWMSCSPGALAKVKLPRSRPTSSSGKKGKRAAWAKETETQPLGDKVQRLKSVPSCCFHLSMTHIAFCFLQNVFSIRKVCWVQWIRGRGLPRGQGRGSVRQRQSCHCLDVISVQSRD